MIQKVAFQGHLGAYTHLACLSMTPDAEVVPCATFDEVFHQVEEGICEFGVIPFENSTAGRVADNHRLMPRTDLKIVAEFFQPIHHCLLGIKGSNKSEITGTHSHLQALMQCEHYLKEHNIKPMEHADTAGAAEMVSRLKDPHTAAIASSIAAEMYSLDILEENIQDTEHNTTRFLLLSKDGVSPSIEEKCITTFLFRVRNIPAALYKALGGFATNGVNITKLESYITDGSFAVAQFYVDIEGHPEESHVARALEELDYFSEWIKILGTYKAAPYRDKF